MSAEFDDFGSRLPAMLARSAKLQAERESFLSTIPPSTPCKRHPQILRPRDDGESWGQHSAIYKDCEFCATSERLQREGVLPIDCEATLESWKPDGDQMEIVLKRIHEFVAMKRGFLILLGDVGTGKTHLAVGVQRTFSSGLFVKQQELLRQLRLTYNDHGLVDPVELARKAKCLVLDEVGFSGGGRDELPMLHDVLDHRHGYLKPTILTSNLTYEELRAAIGARMADRLKESAFAVVTLSGRSRRSQTHDKYFGGSLRALKSGQSPLRVMGTCPRAVKTSQSRANENQPF